MRKSISVRTRFNHFFPGKRIALVAILLAVSTVATAAFVSVRLKAKPKAAPKTTTVGRPANPNTADITGYVHKGRLSSGIDDALKQLGDRLEKPGKERLVLLGNLSEGTGQPANPIRLTLEYPHRLRLEEIRHGQNQILGFDGHETWKHGAAPEAREKDLIESLIFDSADHYFIGQMQGFATRLLGTGFRPDGAGADYSGPLYDVYQVSDQIPDANELREQPKFYHFNSQSRLLEQINYETTRDGQPLKVEVRLGAWQQVDGQRIPTSITRLENGETVMQLTINSVSIGQRTVDGSFNKQ